MKLIDKKHSTYKTENISESSFTIKASAKAFEVLSKQIYSNPITPAIRELAANAYDSHVEAANRGYTVDKPFEVHVPTTLEPWFSVQDFGVGMSEDEINKIYTTYFDSTKNTSNDYVGCLGLGSKSPFCYTDTFNLISIQNGIKLVYIAFLENGLPKISKIDELKTTESNGVYIQFSVKESDISEFKAQCSKIYNKFKIKPKIIGDTNFTFNEDEYSFIQPTWKLRNNKSYSCCVMGNIEYPLQYHNLKISNVIASSMISSGIELYFNIGELEISANRESLYFDDRTIKNITNKLTQAYEELKDIINQRLNSKTNKWESICEYNTIINSLYLSYQLLSLLKSVKFTYNNNFIFGDLSIRIPSIEEFSTYSFRYGRRSHNTGKAKTSKEYSIQCNSNVVFFENDCINGIRKLMNFINVNSDTKMYYDITNQLDKIIEYTEYPKNKILKLSTLVYEKPKKTYTRNTTTIRRLQKLSYSKYWYPTDIDISKGEYFYVTSKSINSIINSFVDINPSFNISNVVYLPPNYINKYKKMKNWKCLNEYISTYIKNTYPNIDEIVNVLFHSYSIDATVCDSIQTFKNCKLCCDDITRVITVIEKIELYKSKFKTAILYVHANNLKNNIEFNVSNIFKKIYEKYPMLQFVYKPKNYIKEINNYINIIHNSVDKQ